MGSFLVKGFGHVGIQSSDQDRSFAFYEKHLGFKKVWENVFKGKKQMFIGNGNCVIELLEGGDERYGDGQINHLSILVDDVEKAMAELQEMGIVFETDYVRLDETLYPNGEKFVTFRGPDNERIQLEQIL